MSERAWRRGHVSTLILAVAVALLLAGCGGGGGGGGGGGTSSAVSVTSPSASPATVSPGNTVVIEAHVTATAGVANVVATVTKPDGSVVGPIPMTLKAGSTNTFQAIYGGSAGQLDETGDYTVSITATDAASNSAKSEAFKFTMDSPPPPPPP